METKLQTVKVLVRDYQIKAPRKTRSGNTVRQSLVTTVSKFNLLPASRVAKGEFRAEQIASTLRAEQIASKLRAEQIASKLGAEQIASKLGTGKGKIRAGQIASRWNCA